MDTSKCADYIHISNYERLQAERDRYFIALDLISRYENGDIDAKAVAEAALRKEG